ncbi:MAG: hypothetical protein KBT41_04025 [bacterium]|nr:hypothetical protein [Candidatus Colousia faecequi]
MKTKHALLIMALLVCCSIYVSANEEYNTRFNNAVDDSLALAKKVLADWEQNGPHDGDFYAAYFNLYLNQGIEFGMCLFPSLPLYYRGDPMTMTDSLGNVVSYLYSGVMKVDTLIVDTAIRWLNEGIKLFPERLDLRFGLSTTYAMLDNGDSMYSVMRQTVEWVMANPAVQLTWTSDKELEDKDKTIESTIQDYISNCYNTVDWTHLAESFVELGLRYLPKSYILTNDKAVILMDKGDMKGALKTLKKAQRLNPEDELIKENIEFVKQEMKKNH